MGTGPRVEDGHDLALTELIDERGHRFLVEAGSDRGRQVLAELPTLPAGADDRSAAAAQTERTAASMGRSMDTDGIRELLQANPEHPRWADVAERCLSCGNCTLVCPTCFCSTAENVTDLAGGEATHTRLWDSCFTLEHSYVHGGSVRADHALALPPVDDAQALDVDRPVRLVRLRGLRALRHVVPGGDRHHRGGRRDPRLRPAGGTR